MRVSPVRSVNRYLKAVLVLGVVSVTVAAVLDVELDQPAITTINGPATVTQQAQRLSIPTLIVTPTPALLAVSAELIAATNVYRATFLLGPVLYNAQLTAAAEGHTIDMATNQFVSHIGSDGATLWDRVRRAGYTRTYLGENVAAGFPDFSSVLAAWIASPLHQLNLIDPLFNQIGVAAAVASTGRVYWTMNLGSSIY